MYPQNNNNKKRRENNRVGRNIQNKGSLSYTHTTHIPIYHTHTHTHIFTHTNTHSIIEKQPSQFFKKGKRALDRYFTYSDIQAVNKHRKTCSNYSLWKCNPN
jgi:hypothetical protein